MPKTLVVVESPAKAKTIEKYLGGDYTVRASYGHIRDLPKSKLGVDPEHDFEPEYIVPEDSERHVRELKSALKRSDDLILATDYDREGEAIAFHVATLLGVDPVGAKRATFTEITRDAILEAIASPRGIDMKLVDAQQARRVLDRLVGLPDLADPVEAGAAGAVGGARPVRRRTADRRARARDRRVQPGRVLERRRAAHAARTPSSRSPRASPRCPRASSRPRPDKKGILLGAEADAATHVERLSGANYRVTKVEQKERKRSPAPPFTTSTLQQEAARKLGFGARKTMSVAQRLYEGIDLPGEGIRRAHHLHADGLGDHRRHRAPRDRGAREDRLRRARTRCPSSAATRRSPATPRRRTRPCGPRACSARPARVASALDRDQLRLYTMIWQRTMATQMAEARFNQVGVDIEARRWLTSATGCAPPGRRWCSTGSSASTTEGRDDEPDEDAESMLPALTAEQLLRMLEVLPEQHFTQPPPRFTEASLVKTLEELGIGRPSTYASIMSTIQRPRATCASRTSGSSPRTWPGS